ncbi:IS3 family transposase [Streptomyces sp. 1222.5]|uniref:IS3 family transposase n=1 Tax=Streptomyces sp. 1222.5 TaxID=1881026 RepID=UPI003EBD4000
MKNYPPDFKADAVALYQSRPGATIKQIAADLGVNPETLRNWVRAAGASRPRGRGVQAPTEPAVALEAENAALRKKVRELEEEREILRKAAKYFAGRRAGEPLPVRRRPPPPPRREAALRHPGHRPFQLLLLAFDSCGAGCPAPGRCPTRRRIRAVHQESDGTYGVPRITAELHDDGERVNHKKVARVMRSIGLAGVRLRRRHRTTIGDPAAAKAPDLLGRDFSAAETNTKYVGDITRWLGRMYPGRRGAARTSLRAAVAARKEEQPPDQNPPHGGRCAAAAPPTSRPWATRQHDRGIRSGPHAGTARRSRP